MGTDEGKTQREVKKPDHPGFTLSTIVAVGCGIPLVLGVFGVVAAILRAMSVFG